MFRPLTKLLDGVGHTAHTEHLPAIGTGVSNPKEDKACKIIWITDSCSVQLCNQYI